MPNVTLSAQQLEEREVPAAAMFADIMPGIWGSYPLNITPSGEKLYFSADNGHGYEPYVTDGTPGSARMLKDIKPGLGGSNPTNFVAADNGIIYFTASDGSQTNLWRSDGTREGTLKVAGVPAGLSITPQTAIGRNGVLHFVVTDPTNGMVQWWKTDGTATKTWNIGITSASYATFRAIDGNAVLVMQTKTFDQVEALWKYDATTDSINPWQIRQYGNTAETGRVELAIGIEISPGKFIHPTQNHSGVVTSLWVREGIGGPAPQLLQVLRGSGQYSYFAGAPVRFQGKAYFGIQSDDPAVAGLWVTDGTVAGTKKSDLPVSGILAGEGTLSVVGGRLMIRTIDETSGNRIFFSNGMPAGTTEAPKPAGATGKAFYVATIPASDDAPGGAVFMRLGSTTGPLYRTDGTAAGTVWVDPTGLPSGINQLSVTGFTLDGFGRVVPKWQDAGVYFDGGLFFSAKNGEQRPELWKWDAAGPAVPPQVVAPAVEGVAVNDGAAQRSMVKKLTVTFDREVDLSDGAIEVRSTTGQTQLLFLTEEVIGGKTVVTIGFSSSLPGWSLADGRYTLTVKAGRVWDVETGGVMETDFTFNFTRFFSDLNGDGSFDRDARWMVHDALGKRIGEPGYIAALDFDGNGVIDAADEVQVVRRWGKSV